ncbi:hypothetical protein D9M71_429090 [compost metagenome]
MPGNRSSACAWIIEDRKTKLSPGPPMSSGTRMMRGNRRGAGMIARPESRPKASTPSSSTMKFRLLFTSSGNGWVGSRPMGVMIGAISSRK